MTKRKEKPLEKNGYRIVEINYLWEDTPEFVWNEMLKQYPSIGDDFPALLSLKFKQGDGEGIGRCKSTLHK